MAKGFTWNGGHNPTPVQYRGRPFAKRFHTGTSNAGNNQTRCPRCSTMFGPVRTECPTCARVAA